ncbi:DUF975 family protein [Lapidilactobacillus bayanensis]|uniref:DUF975 family protein n=1 Tax=Lapidilactobacillus bayanensis TaxID=2485998 RepID=UPI000F770AC9|nr:DUF975 family protein [Lapidilactobacillus bayanensis]
MLFLFPGLIKGLAYSQAYFIYKDKLRLTGLKPGLMDCLNESQRLMEGHKLQFLSLQLSFVGWGFLVIFTFGLAGFYVYPYYWMTLSGFYAELVDKR